MVNNSQPDDSPPTDSLQTTTRIMPPGNDPGGASNLPPSGTFPGYDILTEINRGGQGLVYRARQQSTLREVAIKVPLADALATQEGQARFQREIESIAKLQHPNVVTVFHADKSRDGRPFYVMEFVDGLRLGEYVRRHRLSIREIVSLAAEVCDGLAAAHQADVIHRDLKPGNILVDARGHPRILDFGLARSLVASPSEALSTSRDIIGTLAYMAPEQARGDHDHTTDRTDIHAVGVILYEALTGHHPFPKDQPHHLILQAILHFSPAKPSDHDRRLRGDLNTILLKCLQKEPSRRYRTASELAADLRRYLAGEAILAKRDSRVYLARKWVQGAARRHFVLSHIFIILLTVVLVHALAEPVLFQVAGLDRWYERWITTRVALPPGDLEHVRVVAITDSTEIHTLTTKARLNEITPTNPRSLRRLHGYAMNRIAEWGPRAVVWDITFSGESPFDEDLAGGIRSLRERNVPVICAVDGWWSEVPAPSISSVIAPLVRWGTIFTGFDTAPPQVQLVLQSGLQEPLPSLALSTLAAVRHPEWEPFYTLDPSTRSISILYQQHSAEVPQHKKWLDSPDRIELAGIRTADQDSSDLLRTRGIRQMDRIGIHCFKLRPEWAYENASLDYARLFDDDPTATRAMLAGKIVMMADRRKGIDEHRAAPDRIVSGCYAQASVIEELLSQAENPHEVAQHLTFYRLIDTFIFAGFGVLTMLTLRRFRWTVVIILVALSFLGGMKAATWLLALWNPMLPMLSLVVGAGLTLGLRRFRRQAVEL